MVQEAVFNLNHGNICTLLIPIESVFAWHLASFVYLQVSGLVCFSSSIDRKRIFNFFFLNELFCGFDNLIRVRLTMELMT